MPFRTREAGVLPKLPYNRKIRNRLRRRHRGHYDRMRDATWRFLLDSLEPRILLSADMPGFGNNATDLSSNAADQNLLVRIEATDDGAGTITSQAVRIFDADDVAAGPISEFTSADTGWNNHTNIFTGGGDDTITLEYLGAATPATFGVTIDAGTGDDSITVVSFGDNWEGDVSLTAEAVTISDDMTVDGAVTIDASQTETATSDIGEAYSHTSSVTVNGSITATGDVDITSSVAVTANDSAVVNLARDYNQTATASIDVNADIAGASVSLSAVTDVSITASVDFITAIHVSNVDVTTDTQIDVDSGASLTANGTGGDITVSAQSDIDVDITLGVDDGNIISTAYTYSDIYDAVASFVTVDRDTDVTIGSLTDQSLTANDDITISATNTGAIASDVNSNLFGAAFHDYDDDSATVLVTNVDVNAGDALSVTASNTTQSTAESKFSFQNADTSATSVSVAAGSVLNADTISLTATDSARYDSVAADFDFDITYGSHSATDFGLTMAVNEVERSVSATLVDSTFVEGAALTVSATNDMTLTSNVETIAITAASDIIQVSTMSFGGTLSFNELNGDVSAYISGSDTIADPDAGDASNAGSITVSATNSALMDSRANAETTIIDGSGAAFGLSLAFNLMGYDVTDIKTLALTGVDALLGTSFGDSSDALEATAYISNSNVTVDGAVLVQATNESILNATNSNAVDVQAAAISLVDDATSAGAAFILANNKVLSKARAEIRDSAAGEAVTSTAGKVGVKASDDAQIYSNTKVTTETSSLNDGGATVVDEILGLVSKHDFRTDGVSVYDEGIFGSAVTNTQTINYGTRVYLYDDFDGLDGTGEYEDTSAGAGDGDDATPGAIYIYLGTTDDINLATTDYRNKDLWREVTETNIVPTGFNLTESDSNSIGGMLVRNEVDGGAEAVISNATVVAETDVTVEAEVNAIE